MSEIEREVRAALAQAGLTAGGDDLAELVSGWPGLRAMADRVTALADAVEELPELEFRLSPPAARAPRP